MAKKMCLVLGAGGSRGVAHIGVLKALEENGIKPDYIVGCSMGAVVGACYAKGMTIEKMKEAADSLKLKDIADFSIGAFTKKGLMRSHKIRNTLLRYIGDVSFDQLKIPFKSVACDLKSGKSVAIGQGSVEKAVRASAAIPIVFRPVEIDDMILIDGGAIDRVPIEHGKEFNPDVLIAVDVLGALRTYTDCSNIISHTIRITEVVDWHICKNKYEKYDFDLLLMPDLGNMSQFKVDDISFAFEKGYEITMQNLDKIKKLLK